jgi:endogenous inhibitor of DNA gyrase (YacG/DUF329 family)
MATYCFRCPECDELLEWDRNDWLDSYCSKTGKNVRLKRDYKAESAALLRENIRAVPRG